MHGPSHRLLLAALAAALIPAAPAAADETLGLGQPAAVDGVVTSWTVTGAGGGTVRLRSLQGAATTATSDPATPGAGAIAARLPVAAGGTLTLLGASGSPTLSAHVEPDADGDGYGDSAQDACPGDAVDHEAPCDGTETFGSALTLAPDPTVGSGAPVQARQLTADGTVPAATKAGVLVRWRLRAEPGYGDTVLQLLRPTTPGGTTFTVVAESAPVHATTSDVIRIAANFAVRAGDRLGVRTVANGGNADLGAVARRDGDDVAVDGATLHDRRLLVQADVEPDADGDGKGDLTQDRADVELTGVATPTAPATSPWEQVFTVRNVGPDTALGVRLQLRGAGVAAVQEPAPGVTCSSPVPDQGGVGADCTIAKLAPGQSIVLRPSYIEAAIYPPFPGPRSATATITGATTTDPDLTNNGPVTLTTVLTVVPTPGKPYIPPPPPRVGLCANVIRGTRDDDALRGTAFGDRLVGGDGGDLLKGLGGDDCLEGGAGNDVLDGGDGDDRLAGSAGRDRLIGGKGADKLTGGKGNDRLSGGAGNDTLSPGAGHDAIDAGAGNDIINSVDGVRETVECGPGRDTVRADRRDRLKHCEKVTRKR
jgi:Ca2+-binding RTX toxin-like protein